MESNFQFVDGAHVDKATRKRIRSHVMKGRNAGKTFHRPSRLELAKRPRDYRLYHRTFNAPNDKDKDSSSSQKRSVSMSLSKSVGDVFVTVMTPVPLTPFSIQVIHQFFAYVVDKIYPSHIGVASGEAMTLWLQVLLADEAAFHCSIAVMEACNGFFLKEGQSSPEALFHLSQTFQLVNKRLDSNEALSDSTLAIIIMLIIQEHIRKDVMGAKIHFEGLRKMVELRGGLSELEHNPSLLLKICKMDVSYALQFGGALMFYRDRMPEARATLTAAGFKLDPVAAECAIQHQGLHPVLYDILLDVTSISLLFNCLPPGQKINVTTFSELVLSVSSRLVRFHSLSDPPLESATEAAYHIGLTIFMMSTFLQHDRRRIIAYEFVSTHLKDIIDRGTEALGKGLALWLTFLGGIWVLGDPDTFWLRQRVRGLVERLEINSWEEVQSLVSQFPWIRPFHDKVGLEVWNLAHQDS